METVERSWGSYTVIEEGENYKIKRITVLSKQSLSLQLHHHRSEHWVVVKGTAEVELNGVTMLLRKGEGMFVNIGMHHRLRNPGLITLELIEVQIGDYLCEDDIIRMDGWNTMPKDNITGALF